MAINASPQMTLTVSMGDALYGLIYSARLWNKHARVALREELEKHHRQRIPRHFDIGAHQVYGYAPRTKKTRAIKERVWNKPPDLDLVRSGQSKQQIKSQHQITFSGQFGGGAAGGTLIGRLIMRLPIPESRQGHPNRINLDEIKREITAITDSEVRDLAEGFNNRLVDQINSHHGPNRTVHK